jgi:hypothetical protein
LGANGGGGSRYKSGNSASTTGSCVVSTGYTFTTAFTSPRFKKQNAYFHL